MKRKIVSVFVCMLLIATTMVFVPKEMNVKADPGGGGEGENEYYLDFEYM